MAAAISFVCRGRSSSNRNRFGILKQLGQRRHTTTQAAAPTLDVLLHDPIRTVGSWGLPNADCSTKSAILSKNSNVFNEYGDTMRFGVKEPKLLFTGNRDYGLIKNNGQLIFRSISSINQASSCLRASPQGDRAYFHTTRMSSSCRKKRSYPERGDKLKLELRISTVDGLWIHQIVPVEIKGKRVVRFCNRDAPFVDNWLPYTKLMVKNQPEKLRANLGRYWLKPTKDDGFDHDDLLASLMLNYGVHKYVSLFDNYWEETLNIALPFIQENSSRYLGKVLKDFPQEYYSSEQCMEGLSLIAGKEVATEHEDDVGFNYDLGVGILLLFDEEKKLMNHPERHVKGPRNLLGRHYLL